MARTMGGGQSSYKVGGQGVERGGDQACERGVGGGSSQSSRLAGDRGVRRGGGQADERGVGRGGGQAGERGVRGGSSQSSLLDRDQGVRRGGGRGGGQANERGGGRGGGQAGERGISRGSSLVSSQGSGLAGYRGSGQAGDRVVRRGGSQACDDDESVVHAMSHPIDGGDYDDDDNDYDDDDDDDDESTFPVASHRRGCASQVQVPELINREWIYIKNGEFSNQGTSTRIIGSSLRALWSGPWDSWRDVPNEHKTRMFERFQSYFQWEERCDAEIRRFWEKCIAGKFPNMLKTVRNKAKKMATEQGLQVGNDMSVLLKFKPAWIRTDIWKQMIDNWNTPTWKAKSKRNKRIRSKPTGGKHTLGSQSYATAKRKAAMIMGREPLTHEMWKQTHCRKGSRPLDKDPSGSSSLVSDIDSEWNIQEENLVWVDDRAEETWAKYDGYLVEKYRDEPPKFDQDLWKRAAGGMKKGKVYGLGVVTDPYVHGRHDPEIEKLNEVIKELVKEKEEDKERFNEILTELMAQREKDKAEKEEILVRMAKIEAVLKTSVRK